MPTSHSSAGSRRLFLACCAGVCATYLLCLGSAGVPSFVAAPLAGALRSDPCAAVPAAVWEPAQRSGRAWASLALPGILAAAAAACAARGLALRVRVRRSACPEAGEVEAAASRRALIVPSLLATAGVATDPAFAVAVDVPDRINSDPYQLIGMANPDNSKEDQQEFYMKKSYKNDTYQVMKHMKISGSLDKGTPNMERWNKRVKEEMNDWVALYRRQDAVVGRQSYYSLYSAINTLASHFTSYGPKFPFPSKRRPRFYELINTTEKYLEKGK